MVGEHPAKQFAAEGQVEVIADHAEGSDRRIDGLVPAEVGKGCGRAVVRSLVRDLHFNQGLARRDGIWIQAFLLELPGLQQLALPVGRGRVEGWGSGV